MSEATERAVEVITPSCPVFERWVGGPPDFDKGLIWAEQGMGALRVTDPPYDAGYFEKYQKYAKTPMGRKITEARVDLVRNLYGDGHVIDVGIGCGAFVEARNGWTWGYDINPIGVRWLQEQGRWRDPYEQMISCVTLWDVLEHIQEPKKLLDNVTRWAFISCPIVPGDGPVAPDWKHYKPREHCWYWTTGGIVRWMGEHGFRCRAKLRTETTLGREDIGTFAFERVRS